MVPQRKAPWSALRSPKGRLSSNYSSLSRLESTCSSQRLAKRSTLMPFSNGPFLHWIRSNGKISSNLCQPVVRLTFQWQQTPTQFLDRPLFITFWSSSMVLFFERIFRRRSSAASYWKWRKVLQQASQKFRLWWHQKAVFGTSAEIFWRFEKHQSQWKACKTSKRHCRK